jgi:hypothetical protein
MGISCSHAHVSCVYSNPPDFVTHPELDRRAVAARKTGLQQTPWFEMVGWADSFVYPLTDRQWQPQEAITGRTPLVIADSSSHTPTQNLPRHSGNLLLSKFSVDRFENCTLLAGFYISPCNSTLENLFYFRESDLLSEC